MLIGLLHDIGRFEQVKVYDTFSDIDSIDHADYGVEILGDYIDGDKNTAKFNFPVNITADSEGSLYVADKGNLAIRKIDLAGNVTTITKDIIKRPSGLAIKDGFLYVTDTLLNRVFKVRL